LALGDSSIHSAEVPGTKLDSEYHSRFLGRYCQQFINEYSILSRGFGHGRYDETSDLERFLPLITETPCQAVLLSAMSIGGATRLRYVSQSRRC
jgi:hypothetical protein